MISKNSVSSLKLAKFITNCGVFIPHMKMPVLADIRRTQEELSLALAELDNIEAAVNNFETRNGSEAASGSDPGPANHNTNRQLKEKVEFLSEENRELSQVSNLIWILSLVVYKLFACSYENFC